MNHASGPQLPEMSMRAATLLLGSKTGMIGSYSPDHPLEKDRRVATCARHSGKASPSPDTNNTTLEAIKDSRESTFKDSRGVYLSGTFSATVQKKYPNFFLGIPLELRS